MKSTFLKKMCTAVLLFVLSWSLVACSDSPALQLSENGYTLYVNQRSKDSYWLIGFYKDGTVIRQSLRLTDPVDDNYNYL